MRDARRAVLIIAVMVMPVILQACSSGPGEYDSLAQCLAEKGVMMYGTEWCPHCKNQKAEFGNSFQYIDYVDCDRSREICALKKIEGYPTWIVDGKKYTGEQTLSRLASLSGCEIA